MLHISSGQKGTSDFGPWIPRIAIVEKRHQFTKDKLVVLRGWPTFWPLLANELRGTLDQLAIRHIVRPPREHLVSVVESMSGDNFRFAY